MFYDTGIINCFTCTNITGRDKALAKIHIDRITALAWFVVQTDLALNGWDMA